MEKETTEEVKEIKIGKFKPSKQILGFVANVSGTMTNLVSEVAYLTPGKIYGMMSKEIRLKFEVCDDDTMDITNMSDEKLDDKQMESILEDVCTGQINNYASKNVFGGVKFENENGELTYAHTTIEKPFDKLKRLANKEKVQPSDEARSKIQALLAKHGKSKPKVEMDEESGVITLPEEQLPFTKEVFLGTRSDGESPVIEEIVEEKTTDVVGNSHIEEAFKKMEEDKIIELNDEVEKKTKAMSKITMEIQSRQSNFDKIESQVELLNKRLKSFNKKEDFNGYLFSVSDKVESNKDIANLSDDTIIALRKVCETIKIEYDKVYGIVFGSYYKIFLTKETELELEHDKKTMEKEIIEKIQTIDPKGKFIMRDDHIEYIGDVEWHNINSEMERLGFKTDDRFDDMVREEPSEIAAKVEETVKEVKETTLGLFDKVKKFLGFKS
jgi:hypothetical protein